MSRAVLLLLGAAVTACGSAAPTPRPCPPPVITPPHAEAGPIAVAADRERIKDGVTATFTVSVVGPARFQADCAGAVQLLVSDTADQRIFAGESAPSNPESCGDVQLAAGRRTVYAVTWRPEPTLPSGRYIATVLLGDQPGLTLPLIVDNSLDTRGCA